MSYSDDENDVLEMNSTTMKITMAASSSRSEPYDNRCPFLPAMNRGRLSSYPSWWMVRDPRGENSCPHCQKTFLSASIYMIINLFSFECNDHNTYPTVGLFTSIATILFLCTVDCFLPPPDVYLSGEIIEDK